MRASVELSAADRLRYRDVRRFGTWLVLSPDELDAYLSERLGREPLERGFDSRYLAAKLGARRAPVKALLLDQRVVAGLGNIYADEALWWARIHPLRPGNDLTADEVRALARGVRTAIRRGIERQGADLGDGAYTIGAMQDEFRVVRTDGRAVPALPDADREDAGRAAAGRISVPRASGDWRRLAPSRNGQRPL